MRNSDTSITDPWGRMISYHFLNQTTRGNFFTNSTAHGAGLSAHVYTPAQYSDLFRLSRSTLVTYSNNARLASPPAALPSHMCRFTACRVELDRCTSSRTRCVRGELITTCLPFRVFITFYADNTA
jgi:hypothetical protein